MATNKLRGGGVIRNRTASQKTRSVNRRPIRRTRAAATKGSMPIQQRHSMRQRQHRNQMIRRRITLGTVSTAAVIAVLMFLTPIFNIQQVVVSGNAQIPSENLSIRLSPMEGRNLFKVHTALVEELLAPEVYVDSVSMKRHYFPPSVSVSIVERQPACYIDRDGMYILFDTAGLFLEQTEASPLNVPEVLGVGDGISQDNVLNREDENIRTMMEALAILRETELLNKIDDLDFSNLSDITFVYDGRLTVRCGSELDFERKMRLFKTAVTNAGMPQNARGTVDLSVTGKAMYTP